MVNELKPRSAWPIESSPLWQAPGQTWAPKFVSWPVQTCLQGPRVLLVTLLLIDLTGEDRPKKKRRKVLRRWRQKKKPCLFVSESSSPTSHWERLIKAVDRADPTKRDRIITNTRGSGCNIEGFFFFFFSLSLFISIEHDRRIKGVR